MGFEDDLDYTDSFETDIVDPDSEQFAEKPKKMSRKEMREAKKKNAERTADLPKKKKGLFGRRERMDDDDSLSGEHLFDPTPTPMVSTARDRSRDYDTSGPVMNRQSEFSYLFAPSDDDSADDVYPEQSIYSDNEAAKTMLAGLAYDESKDGDSSEFDQYFENPSQVRPPSQFTFKKREPHHDDLPDLDDSGLDDEELAAPPPPVKVPLKAAPKVTPKVTPQVVAPPPAPEPPQDSYLPDLRPDSVFIPPSERRPVTEPTDYAVSERAIGDREGSAREHEETDYHDNDMPQDDFPQEFIPYQGGGMYPPYAMPPMNQMMNYPVVIPAGSQQQSSTPSYQAIPIPFPMPMPMPMPMYQGYYPPYPQYPPQYPPYPAPDYYGRYPAPIGSDERYDDRRRPSRRQDIRSNDRYYDERREGRSGDRYYDERREGRSNDRYYDERREGRSNDRYYDERREGRSGDRYYDERQEGRSNDRTYREEAPQQERTTYPKPAYEPPYRQEEPYLGQQPAAAVTEYAAPAAPPDDAFLPSPEPIQTPSVTPQPMMTDPLPTAGSSGFDFFNPSFGGDFGSNALDSGNDLGGNDLGGSDLGGSDLGGNDFGGNDFGGSNTSESSFDEFSPSFPAVSSSPADDAGKAKGGRFKKRR